MKQRFLPILYSSLGAAFALIAVDLAPQAIGSAKANPSDESPRASSPLTQAKGSDCQIVYSYGDRVFDDSVKQIADRQGISVDEAASRSNNESVTKAAAGLIAQGYNVVGANYVLGNNTIGAWAMLCRK